MKLNNLYILPTHHTSYKIFTASIILRFGALLTGILPQILANVVPTTTSDVQTQYSITKMLEVYDKHHLQHLLQTNKYLEYIATIAGLSHSHQVVENTFETFNERMAVETQSARNKCKYIFIQLNSKHIFNPTIEQKLLNRLKQEYSEPTQSWTEYLFSSSSSISNISVEDEPYFKYSNPELFDLCNIGTPTIQIDYNHKTHTFEIIKSIQSMELIRELLERVRKIIQNVQLLTAFGTEHIEQNERVYADPHYGMTQQFAKDMMIRIDAFIHIIDIVETIGTDIDLSYIQLHTLQKYLEESLIQYHSQVELLDESSDKLSSIINQRKELLHAEISVAEYKTKIKAEELIHEAEKNQTAQELKYSAENWELYNKGVNATTHGFNQMTDSIVSSVRQFAYSSVGENVDAFLKTGMGWISIVNRGIIQTLLPYFVIALIALLIISRTNVFDLIPGVGTVKYLFGRKNNTVVTPTNVITHRPETDTLTHKLIDMIEERDKQIFGMLLKPQKRFRRIRTKIIH